MAVVDRYLARSLFMPTLLIISVLIAVMLVFYSAQNLAQAVQQQHPLHAVLYLIVLRVAAFLDVLLPTSLSLGVVIGLGKLYAGSEITALAAAGIGPARIARAVVQPALVIAALVACATLLIRPFSYAEIYRIQAEIAIDLDARRIEPGRFVALNKEWLVHAGDRSGSELLDVLLQFRGESHIDLIRASRVFQEPYEDGIRLVFIGDVHSYRLTKDGRETDIAGQFRELRVQLPPPVLPTRERIRRAETLSTLLNSDDSFYQAESQYRLIGPVSALLLALAAVPMSRSNPRQGRSSNVLLATLMVSIYFSLIGSAIHGVESESLARLPGAWLVPISFAVSLLLHALWLRRRGAGTP